MTVNKDIIVRKTKMGNTVWISEKTLCRHCGVSAGYLAKKARPSYKKALPPSWRRVMLRGSFFLGAVAGASWRWALRHGTFYYDYDTIPDKSPHRYRSKLPPRDRLAGTVMNTAPGQDLPAVKSKIKELIESEIQNSDTRWFMEYRRAGVTIFNRAKAGSLSRAAAWCRFLKKALAGGMHRELGFGTRSALLEMCCTIIAAEKPEGLHIKKPASLRNKVLRAPEGDALLEYLVSGKYRNQNARKIGRTPLVDTSTGEIHGFDWHEAVIMTYWLNPGSSAKHTKKELYQMYTADAREAGRQPVSFSTFTHYTNSWSSTLYGTRERHGRALYDRQLRPYVPAKKLQYANSLWACDASGIVPYRYMDSKGRWRMMKLYVMMVSDVASRFIAGYSVSRRGMHNEDAAMTDAAMRMALRRNGDTGVLDLITDNHGAFTGAASAAYLRTVCSNFRTISPGNSKANPAEMVFRLFKRRFKSFFMMPETSWDAAHRESRANPDRYNISSLPDYRGAILKLEEAIGQWNDTPLQNGITPRDWFDNRKNPAAHRYDARLYRLISGYRTARDLTAARGILEIRKGETPYRFEIPSDSDSIALISRHIGISPSFRTEVYWNETGADIYTPDGRYILSCRPAPLASKSTGEATPRSAAALAHHIGRGADFDIMIDRYEQQLADAMQLASPGYGFNICEGKAKEDYNRLHGEVSAANINRKEVPRRQNKLEEANIGFCLGRITDINKYTKP